MSFIYLLSASLYVFFVFQKKKGHKISFYKIFISNELKKSLIIFLVSKKNLEFQEKP